MEEDLECPICLDIFGINQSHFKAPKVLKCGDTFCKECLDNITKRTNEEYFQCPLCKENIKKEQNVNDYTSNKKIISIVNSCFNLPTIDIQKDKEDQAIQYNIIALGNPGVGKTSIYNRLSKDIFFEKLLSTSGCEGIIYYIKFRNKKYKLNLQDPSGQEIYKALTKSFLRKSDGVLFIFDISNETSFSDLESWYDLYKEVNEKVVGLLIGNKCDCERKVDIAKAKAFAEKYGLKYLETSAKLDKNIRKAVACILAKIIESKEVLNINETTGDLKDNVDRKESYFSLRSENSSNKIIKKKKINCKC